MAISRGEGSEIKPRQLGPFSERMLGLVQRLRIVQHLTRMDYVAEGRGRHEAGEADSTTETGIYLKFVDDGKQNRLIKVWQEGMLVELPAGSKGMVEIDASPLIAQRNAVENPDKTVLHVKVGSYSGEQVFSARQFAVEADDAIRFKDIETRDLPTEEGPWQTGTITVEGKILNDYLTDLHHRAQQFRRQT